MSDPGDEPGFFCDLILARALRTIIVFFLTFKPLRRLIAILLLLQIASNNVFAEELVKMPTLFTHYYHHAQEHKDTRSFWDYLHKHYSDHHHKDAHLKNHDHEDEDCKLPFKHCGHCVSVHAPALGFMPSGLSADFACFSLASSDFIDQDDSIESLDLCTIWQPPKLA